jgi:hypothetical protein
MPVHVVTTDGPRLKITFTRRGHEVETRLCDNGWDAARSLILLAASVESMVDGDCFKVTAIQ